MHSVAVFITVCCATFTQVDAQAIRPHCAATVDATGRYVAILRNDGDRNSEMRLTVFEHVSEAKVVRRLHDTKLANKNVPGVRMLSCDGRFLVTIDEFGDRGTTPPLGTSSNGIVIYDLVRKEHTTHAPADFLSKESKSVLEDKWYYHNMVFDRTSSRFFPTLPENCKKRGLPFIVVDLPSRTVSIQPFESLDLKDIADRKQATVTWSIADVEPTAKGLLPKTMTQIVSGKPGATFKMSADSSEYTVSP